MVEKIQDCTAESFYAYSLVASRAVSVVASESGFLSRGSRRGAVNGSWSTFNGACCCAVLHVDMPWLATLNVENGLES